MKGLVFVTMERVYEPPPLLGAPPPGLGALRLLPDELLVDLLGWLDPRSLVACAPASHALCPGGGGGGVVL